MNRQSWFQKLLLFGLISPVFGIRASMYSGAIVNGLEWMVSAYSSAICPHCIGAQILFFYLNLFLFPVLLLHSSCSQYSW
jgi:hypothetical protein